MLLEANIITKWILHHFMNFFPLELSVTSHSFMCNFDFNMFDLIFLIFHINYLIYKNIHIFTFNICGTFKKKSKLCFKPLSLKWRVSESTSEVLDLLGIKRVQSDSICEGVTFGFLWFTILALIFSSLCFTAQKAMV